MVEALALLALTIVVLFSGLVIGALRQVIPVRNRQAPIFGGRDASAQVRSAKF